MRRFGPYNPPTPDARHPMARIRFTDNIQRHVACPESNVDGTTVAEALDAYFRSNPRARGYVLDDQHALRTHMNVFVNGRQITDRSGLSDPLGPDDTIHVMQALSGG